MKPINEMSDTELKALAYDLLRQRELIENDIRVINRELNQRPQQKEEPKNPNTEKSRK